MPKRGFQIRLPDGSVMRLSDFAQVWAHAERVDLTRIEVQAIEDALCFTEARAIVSDAHVRAELKIRKLLRRLKP